MKRRALFTVGGVAGTLLLCGVVETVVRAAAVAPSARATAAGRAALQPVSPSASLVPSQYRAIGERIRSEVERRPHFAPGEELPVYKLKPVSAGEVQERAARLANALLTRSGGGGAISAVAMRRDGDRLSVRSGSVRVRAYLSSGFISVMDQDRVFKGHCSLGDAEATAIARRYVAENRVVDLLPGEEMTVAAVKHARSQGVTVDGHTGAPELNSAIVVLGRKLGGKPVIGPGAQVVVFLAGSGDVVGLQRNWREVEPSPASRVKAKDTAAVSNAVTAKAARALGGKLPPGQGLAVKRVDFGYFADGRHRAQSFLQPAYAVHTEVRNGRGPNLANVFLISAGDHELEPLSRPPQGRAAQERPATPPAPIKDQSSG